MKLSELVGPTNTRIYHTLSGDSDQDYFLSKADMSESHWELLMACHHQGSCDDDTEEAAKYFEIADYDKALEYIVSSGIDEDDFYFEDQEGDKERNDERILKYYLWMLSGDIQENL